MTEELATEGYRHVQEGPGVYKLLSCQSVLNSFDSAQFILKELCYMDGSLSMESLLFIMGNGSAVN